MIHQQIEAHLFRCSSLAALMGDPRSIDPALLDDVTGPIAAKKTKTPEDHAILAPLYDMTLPATAKTMLNKIVKEYVYEYREELSSKYTEKGKQVENDSIELYNERFFTQYKKNTERRSNGFITGECDICADDKIIDIKSSWSLPTFPEIDEEGLDTTYEWQMVGYMWLWEKEAAEVAYCLVDTPEELIRYEPLELHSFERLAIELRITTVTYLRDRSKEERIKRRITTARKYMHARADRIYSQHLT